MILLTEPSLTEETTAHLGSLVIMVASKPGNSPSELTENEEGAIVS